MLLQIHPDNPDRHKIYRVVETLRAGGVIIYPTDTVYGLGCDIFNSKAVERVARIKGVSPVKAFFSILCRDLSHLSDFTRQIDNTTFKLMKKYLPGPFTFVLDANSNVPKLFKNKKKTIGIRIPKHNIPLEIVRLLGNPILTTSIHDVDKVIDYTTDPELIYENFGHLVDIIIDGGFGNNIPSTIIDCTGDMPKVVREGLGIFEG
jgi:tRNA threonylcarbamoyl adenosine modification protein (Sua5/YciO/YrdC/YwlC family)